MQQSDANRSTRSPETRQRLLDFGLLAFTNKGSSGVNLVEDVLRPASISIGSFYYQFTDKTELLCEVLDRAIECRHLVVTEIFEKANDEESFRKSVRAAVEVLFDSFDNVQHGWHMQIRESTHEDNTVRRIITKGRGRWTAEIATFVELTLGIDGFTSTARAEQAVIYGTGLAKYYLELPPTTRKKRRSELIANGTLFLMAGLSASH
jgi:AcrR family transcriptional regulator